MYLKRYSVEKPGHASYAFGANGEAAIVDPKRHVDACIAGIIASFESHPCA